MRYFCPYTVHCNAKTITPDFVSRKFVKALREVLALDTFTHSHQRNKIYPGLGHVNNRRHQSYILVTRSLGKGHIISLSSWEINRDINWQ